VKIYYFFGGKEREEETIARQEEILEKDFIIYDTLMLQLGAHKINDTVSFIFLNETS
jgi:hypothetical protein